MYRLALLETRIGVMLLGVALFVGCSPDPEFRRNEVYRRFVERQFNSKLERDVLVDLDNALVALFGTPGDPHVPVLQDIDTAALFDEVALGMSAGRVSSDRMGRPHGLYRKHCAHCHGVTGDGAGPTAAFLNPYPRDYRSGIYKFKSTPKGKRPTHQDLKTVVLEGIAGTAMPSFKLLPDDEVESLVQYVRYLAVRGEVERRLLMESTDLEPGERLLDVALAESKPEAFAGQSDRIRTVVGDVVAAWAEAEQSVTPVAEAPADWESDESKRHGRSLFYGPIANCAKCHGDSALGDGQTSDYDDWTKELDPQKPAVVSELVSVGALRPRTIRPRNLRQGVYRGGRRPVDLFLRIHNGIDGTPMPASLLKRPDSPADFKGLSTDDIWHLVAYVRSLPYEAISDPTRQGPNLQRERP